MGGSVALVLFWGMISFAPPVYGGGYRSNLFFLKPLCDMREKLRIGCLKYFSQGETVSKCILGCTEYDDDLCLGVIVNKTDNTCFLYNNCSTFSNCSTHESNVLFYEKAQPPQVVVEPLACVDGVWNATLGKCVCNWPKVGLLCDQMPDNCNQVGEYHPQLNGLSVYRGMRIPGTTRNIKIICFSNSSDARTVLFFHDGDTQFNMTWQDYELGFVTPGEIPYWIGLEKMHAIMGATEWDLVLRYTFRNSFILKEVSYTYSGVVLGDASTNYTLRYSSYTMVSDGTVDTSDHCLSQSNMTAFSTMDADHDADPNENCAEKAFSGWWFSSCNFTCNPLGVFPSLGPTPPTADGYIRLPGFDEQTLDQNLNRVMMLIDY